ncbi:hypothetical protein THAOC_25527, partial [Thalassiosira oceanica]
MTGAREAQFPRAPDRRDPEGDSQAPFPRCQIPPPMAPKAKAPPTSSMMRYGHGSRSDMLELLIVRLVVRSVVAGLLSSSIPPPAAAAPARGFGTAAGFVPSPRARRSLFFHVRRYGSYRDPILLARCLSSSFLDLFPPSSTEEWTAPGSFSSLGASVLSRRGGWSDHRNGGLSAVSLSPSSPTLRCHGRLLLSSSFVPDLSSQSCVLSFWPLAWFRWPRVAPDLRLCQRSPTR